MVSLVETGSKAIIRSYSPLAMNQIFCLTSRGGNSLHSIHAGCVRESYTLRFAFTVLYQVLVIKLRCMNGNKQLILHQYNVSTERDHLADNSNTQRNTQAFSEFSKLNDQLAQQTPSSSINHRAQQRKIIS
ncbi:hypothetical protein CEXT_558631 [Caerostris extrusa]|uniref:Uncharacterized protein n=1 Tax=Caerostris extrusa TaxID=172846 RepID=A0AAV4Y982_CAEEX|nr:hypothetical protein CEXT_558631 [Caerostris extrusa]